MNSFDWVSNTRLPSSLVLVIILALKARWALPCSGAGRNHTAAAVKVSRVVCFRIAGRQGQTVRGRRVKNLPAVMSGHASQNLKTLIKYPCCTAEKLIASHRAQKNFGKAIIGERSFD